MPLKHWRWLRRDQATREAVIEAISEFCERQRQYPGVEWTRFFWSGPSEFVVLSELDVGVNPAKDLEIAAAKIRIDDVAHLKAYEIWSEITA
jgi:hypothetical protein